EPVGKNYAVAIRKIDGSPPIKLGDGAAGALSPDGKWALALPTNGPIRLTLLPVGPGQPRDIPLPQFDHLEEGVGRFMPDGNHVVIDGTEPGHLGRTYIVDLTGAKPPQPITPEGIEANMPSPDGKYVVGQGGAKLPGTPRKLALYPVNGGKPIEFPMES